MKKENKKKSFLLETCMFLIVLTIECFIIAYLTQVVPSEIEILGRPFNPLFFVFGVSVFILLLVVSLVRYRK